MTPVSVSTVPAILSLWTVLIVPTLLNFDGMKSAVPCLGAPTNKLRRHCRPASGGSDSLFFPIPQTILDWEIRGGGSDCEGPIRPSSSLAKDTTPIPDLCWDGGAEFRSARSDRVDSSPWAKRRGGGAGVRVRV